MSSMPQEKDIRHKIVTRWINRARRSRDPYDIFIFLWIAMTIAVQIHRARRKAHSKEEDTNREKILDYFIINKDKVFEAVKGNRDTMIKLIKIKGPRYNDPIIDTGNRDLRDRCSELVRYYTDKRCKLSQLRMAEDMAGLISRIRYSLFHAEKFYNKGYDVRLLRLLNPVFADIVSKIESA